MQISVIYLWLITIMTFAFILKKLVLVVYVGLHHGHGI